ncbi:MAG: 5'/3'-nucleotidase SurE [Lachnospiraceae bacterium]|nr:5'/3'-nucleotidase SurE [Lachnospiraceae bacterium]
MRILITNDDGIDAAGIKKLAQIAAKISNEVYIVAPSGQRSAVSHSITVGKALQVRRVSFPAAVKAAYSCSGMPADCVKVAVQAILEEKPDVVISGINNGQNMGYDSIYSGTVAAAREAVYQGIKGIAVSTWRENYALVDEYLEKLLRDAIDRKLSPHEIWNINFPACGPEDYMGIRETLPAAYPRYKDVYEVSCVSENVWEYELVDVEYEKIGEHTDFFAVEHNYISVGAIECSVLRDLQRRDANRRTDRC